ncbi:RDD family protein [Moraxella oblonga]|uniref:RDD family protein n=1 Tax=Moraxella oblonga TaxID=200413 RepID=UPI0008304149|nr:RDD family protein [Moraxella oblonga]
MIDNTANQDTPEGVTLSLTPAGVVPRAGAWLIDMLIRGAVFTLANMVLVFLGASGWAILLILYFVLDWFYMVLFEVYRGGQTIGKKKFNLRVCTDDGMNVGWQASMIRNVLRFADLPFFFLTALIAILFNSKSKRLGDMVAGTMVVYGHDKIGEMNIKDVSPKTPKIPLYFDEQQAILAFAERIDELPQARKEELSMILSPLTGQTSPTQCTNDIMAYANAIIGKDK